MSEHNARLDMSEPSPLRCILRSHCPRVTTLFVSLNNEQIYFITIGPRYQNEYILWTDQSSRKFISKYYPWFLRTYDRPLDPLLTYPVILPETILVGVSNDLMFSTKRHPFFAQLIHNLATSDHSWCLNYPTVMFSTGPMFLSIQNAIWTSSHAAVLSDPICILPKSLYGKNAKDGEAPHSFFSHFYDSSWYADDAAFIGFLGHRG
ncbi:hypothetical protein EDD18DRAFT_1342947 [Armillaria luteobubalina]|uniref:Uncharacterized protein n=1 Tax=Armillaria luteobubalina TaxID=153913 RepID=A0AA39QRG0_9AGAR|nr:hypothetical protein EDD18DRAFT_1342947 [Armillaria luteobubalina]